MSFRSATLALIFSAGSLVLVSTPAFADPALLTDHIGGGLTPDGMLFFTAYGGLAYVPSNLHGQTISISWDRSFELPASPAGDTFEITRFSSYSVQNADIIINAESYNETDNIRYSPGIFPDPNAYKESTGWEKFYTESMGLSGPILASVVGSYSLSLWPDNCCYANQLNGLSFEQDLQIERFHPDGTPDPFPSAPEPRTTALTLIGIGLGMSLALRSKPQDNVGSV